jgi:hypothetical protein
MLTGPKAMLLLPYIYMVNISRIIFKVSLDILRGSLNMVGDSKYMIMPHCEICIMCSETETYRNGHKCIHLAICRYISTFFSSCVDSDECRVLFPATL